MVGGTGTQELVDSQTRTGAILQQPDLRDEQCGGEEGLQRGSHSFSPGARADTAAGEAGWLASEPRGCAARAGPRHPQPSVPGSLKGLPLLPELLH